MVSCKFKVDTGKVAASFDAVVCGIKERTLAKYLGAFPGVEFIDGLHASGPLLLLHSFCRSNDAYFTLVALSFWWVWWSRFSHMLPEVNSSVALLLLEWK